MEESEMEIILMQDSHILTVHHSRDWDIPQLDYTPWQERARKSIENSVKTLVSVLHLYYMEDDFEDHPNRIKWRRELEERYDWFNDYYKKNGLRFGTVGQKVSGPFDLIKKYYDGPFPDELGDRMEVIRELLAIGPVKFEEINKSTQEKIIYMDSIKQKLYELILDLSQINSKTTT